MTELGTEKLEQTAAAYERLLVPALFEECGQQLVEAADVQPHWHMLDVACGTGIVARTVAERLAPDGSVMGVDINPSMLAVARQVSSDIQWHEASIEALPFDDESFDAVLSQFTLMFFPDPKAALREMVRVLKTDG